MAKPSDYAVALLMKRRKGKGSSNMNEGLGDEKEPAEDEAEDEEIAPTAEAAAFKKLRMAMASEDDAKGAAALKQFLEACGAYEGE